VAFKVVQQTKLRRTLFHRTFSYMADLNQFAATITLSQLLEILSELGISVCLSRKFNLSVKLIMLVDELCLTEASVVDRPAPEPQGASNPANEAVMATVGYALSELGIGSSFALDHFHFSLTRALDTHHGSSNSSGASSGVGEAAVMTEAGTGASASGTVKGKEVAALEDSPPHYAAPSSVAHTRNTKAYLQWYVVIRGLRVGVFQGWLVVSHITAFVDLRLMLFIGRHIVQPLVSGVSRGLQEKCPSEEAGWVIFNQALREGTVEQLSR
jgi:hypothetical protein